MNSACDKSQTPSSRSLGELFHIGRELGHLHGKIDGVIRSLDLLIRLQQPPHSTTERSMPTSRTSSSPSAPISPIRRVTIKLAMEALAWGAGKIGLWLLTLVLPALLAFGAVAWAWIGPLWKWMMG